MVEPLQSMPFTLTPRVEWGKRKLAAEGPGAGLRVGVQEGCSTRTSLIHLGRARSATRCSSSTASRWSSCEERHMLRRGATRLGDQARQGFTWSNPNAAEGWG